MKESRHPLVEPSLAISLVHRSMPSERTAVLRRDPLSIALHNAFVNCRGHFSDRSDRRHRITDHDAPGTIGAFAPASA